MIVFGLHRFILSFVKLFTRSYFRFINLLEKFQKRVQAHETNYLNTQMLSSISIGVNLGNGALHYLALLNLIRRFFRANLYSYIKFKLKCMKTCRGETNQD